MSVSQVELLQERIRILEADSTQTRSERDKARSDLIEAESQIRALQVQLEGRRAIRLVKVENGFFVNTDAVPKFDELSELDKRIASILHCRRKLPEDSEC